MKKYFILLSLVILSGTSQAQQAKQTGFHLEGKLKGLEEKSWVVMTDANRPTDTLARAIVKGGTFILTGQLPEPNLVNLNFVSAKKKTALFIGNETVTITRAAASQGILGSAVIQERVTDLLDVPGIVRAAEVNVVRSAA